jgi:hypothetical protein
MWAQSAPGFSPTGIGTQTEGQGATQTWKLTDTINVAVTWDSAKCWVLPSVAGMAADEKTRLLNHEQGHYNLAALLARDMFLEMMQLKGSRFSSSSAIATEVKALHARYSGVAQPLQDLYDAKTQTDHGRDKTAQAKWDAFIQTAFTKERVPQILTPDGKAYKEEILGILRQNGIPI